MKLSHPHDNQGCHDRLILTLTNWLERRRMPILLTLSAAFMLLAVTAARTRMLYSDEFFTLYVARLAHLDQISKLLATGGEFHPPFFYLLESAFVSAFGETELSLRLPAILGFLLMTVCIFVYLSKRTSLAGSISGALFPALTQAYYFATEARGYGLLLGFSSLAIVCWAAAQDAQRRTIPLVGLALALLASSEASHYGILIVVPLAMAQATRYIRIRQPEYATWIALTSIALHPLLTNRLLHTDIQRATSLWVSPPWTVGLGFYADLLQPAVIPIFVFATLTMGVRLLTPRLRTMRGCSLSPMATHCQVHAEHAALALGFAAFSLWVMIVAKLVTHAYALRYAIPSVVGISILVGLGIARRSKSQQILLLAIFSVYILVVPGLRGIGKQQLERDRDTRIAAWLAARNDNMPIVVDGIGRFLHLSYYAPPNVRIRLVLLVDPKRSRGYIGDDTAERNLLLLNPWFHLPIQDYETFVRSHTAFLLLADHWREWSEWLWLSKGLVDDHRLPLLIDQHGQELLFRLSASN